MQKLEILNTRELKKIKEQLDSQFGYKLESDKAFLRNEKKRLFVITKDLGRIDLKKMKVDKYGMYFGEEQKDGLRLSMEGAFLVGLSAKKNVVELDAKEVKQYFLGEQLEKDLGSEAKYVLLKFDGKVLGCARYKMERILNFMPKIHRGEVVI